MDPTNPAPPRILPAARRYWNDLACREGFFAATGSLLQGLWEFVRDSTPGRLRQRYGDADYDWDYRVNTTSGAVGWRDRLLGVLHSPYQPTEASLFREMLDALQHSNLNLGDFTFVDLGSGKGRTLLMASDHPFRHILGMELLPSLNEIAKQNLARYKSDSQKCFSLETVCADATTARLPGGPLVIYLFNPFPESGLRRAIANLKRSLNEDARPVYVLYHNPMREHVLLEDRSFKKIVSTHQYSVFQVLPPK